MTAMQVELVTADVQVLREAADALKEHGEVWLAAQVNAFASYLNTVITRAILVESER